MTLCVCASDRAMAHGICRLRCRGLRRSFDSVFSKDRQADVLPVQRRKLDDYHLRASTALR